MAPNTGRHEEHAMDEVFVAPDPIPSFPMRAPYDADAQAAARSRIDEIWGEVEEELRLEAERAEQERIAREEAERLERERLEAERIAREEAERLEAERLEKERIAREEAERLERERREREREEAERREREAAEAARREELARELAAASAASHMAPIDEETFSRLEVRPRRGAHFAVPSARTAAPSVAEDVSDEGTQTVAGAEGGEDGAAAPQADAEGAPVVTTDSKVCEGDGGIEVEEPEDLPVVDEAAVTDEAEVTDGVATTDEAVASLGDDIEEGEPAPVAASFRDEVHEELDGILLDIYHLVDFDSYEETTDVPDGLDAEAPRFDDEDEAAVEDTDDLSETIADAPEGSDETASASEDETDRLMREAADRTFTDLPDFSDIDEPEVEVIYDESEIEEAVVAAPAARAETDTGLEATLVLDRVADAVKKLRVEGESAPVPLVREQSSETVIHTEFQVSEDDKELLEVSRRGAASARGHQGGGFFARIGAFVVKALHLDER